MRRIPFLDWRRAPAVGREHASYIFFDFCGSWCILFVKVTAAVKGAVA